MSGDRQADSGVHAISLEHIVKRAWQIPTPYQSVPEHPEVMYLCSHCGISVMQVEIVSGEAKCGRCV